MEKWTSDDFSNKFRCIACGCVLNVLADNGMYDLGVLVPNIHNVTHVPIIVSFVQSH